jgi:hypothetical protein
MCQGSGLTAGQPLNNLWPQQLVSLMLSLFLHGSLSAPLCARGNLVPPVGCGATLPGRAPVGGQVKEPSGSNISFRR